MGDEADNDKDKANAETGEAGNKTDDTDDETKYESDEETNNVDDGGVKGVEKDEEDETVIGIADGTMSVDEYFDKDDKEEAGTDYMDDDGTNEDSATIEYYLIPDA